MRDISRLNAVYVPVFLFIFRYAALRVEAHFVDLYINFIVSYFTAAESAYLYAAVVSGGASDSVGNV